jgi:hypothetical protein
MANEKWDGTSIEEKLEILRRDIIRIRDAQNRLAHQFQEVTRPLAEAIVKVAGASEQIP